MIKKVFQENFNGKDVYKYVIKDGIEAEISELGATLISLKVPQRSGEDIDVIVGFTDAAGITGAGRYRGSTIGRFANRIKDGKFAIDGVSYSVALNDGGKAHLHGGVKGFNDRLFRSEETDYGVKFYYDSPAGEEGYPANLKFAVSYSVRGNELIIEYFGESDGATLLNPTNHAFFNLNGENDGSILDINLKINADKYLPTDEKLIPTGEERAVKNTAFDFTDFKPIGKDICADDEQIKAVNGYDHNFCLNSEHCATAYSEKTGVVMECFTDMPGVQLYTSNSAVIRHGKSDYGLHAAFCLETQLFPDCVNNPQWKSPILRKGDKFYSKTTYAFSLKK